MKIFRLSIMVILLVFSFNGFAKKSKNEKTKKSAESSPSYSSSFHDQEIGAFAGITMANSRSDLTLGGDYERRLSYLDGKLGVIGFAELIMASTTITLFGAGATYHLMGHLRLVLGIGMESASGHSETIIRAGGSYELDVKGYPVSPTLYIDSANGHSATVIGVTVGFPL